MLKGTDPTFAHMLVDAFEETLQVIQDRHGGLSGEDERVKETIARRIAQKAEQGEIDPVQIKAYALAGLTELCPSSS